MSTFPLRMPEELKQTAAAQAEASGVSLNQYITTVLAAGIGARVAGGARPRERRPRPVGHR